MNISKQELLNAYRQDLANQYDSGGKPRSCYICPFSTWNTDFKACAVLAKEIPRCFRIDARLKACPVKIEFKTMSE